MTILCTSDDGVFFEPTLLKHIRGGSRRGNNSETLAMLKDTKNPWQLRDSSGRTLLHFAAKYNHIELAQHLIDLGAEVDARDRKKRTPLMLAVNAKHLASVRVLLKYNVDIFTPDKKGQCALQRAARIDSTWHKPYIVDALISKVTLESLKASKLAVNDEFHRDYPLSYFVQLNDANVTRFLLEAGSPVNAKDSYHGRTALHVAVQFNCLENVQLLLEYGADVHAEDHFGHVALLRVLNSCWNERTTPAIMKLLIDSSGILLHEPVPGVNVKKMLFMHGNLGVVHTLLKYYPIDLRFNVDEPHDDLPPHYYLCLNQQPNVLEELRDFDFDVNLCDKSGLTLLHHAARMGRASSVQFLLDRGADVNAKTSRDETPLFIIVVDKFEDDDRDHDHDNYVNCVEILLHHGADPHVYTDKNAPDEDRVTSNDLIKPILAKLALLEASGSGRPMQTFMRNHVESDELLKDTFEAAKRRLEEIKQIEIVGSVTLFDVITDSFRIPRFARNKFLVIALNKARKIFPTESHYRHILQRRLSKFEQLIQLKEKLVSTINTVLIEIYDSCFEIVAEKIIDYLLDDEWRSII